MIGLVLFDGILAAIINAAIGAVILLMVIGYFKKLRRPRPESEGGLVDVLGAPLEPRAEPGLSRPSSAAFWGDRAPCAGRRSQLMERHRSVAQPG